MLSPEDRRTLLKLARDTIHAAVQGARPPEITNPPPALAADGAAFITLRKSGDLRGCMGHIKAIDPLWKCVREMAESAAMRDPRFHPMTPDEADGLHIEISVLSPMERVRGEEDVVVGTHGLYIRRRRMAGLLLPQVAVDHSFDARTFLEQTCLKAGLPGDAWRNPDAEIFVFSVEAFEEEQE